MRYQSRLCLGSGFFKVPLALLVRTLIGTRFTRGRNYASLYTACLPVALASIIFLRQRAALPIGHTCYPRYTRYTCGDGSVRAAKPRQINSPARRNTLVSSFMRTGLAMKVSIPLSIQ